MNMSVRTLCGAVLLATALSVPRANAGPDLGCSSDGAKATIEQIVAQVILRGVPADQAQTVKFSGDITAIRTASATASKHVCEGVLEMHAAYGGPDPRDTVPPTADEMRSEMDAMMRAANLPHDVVRAVHETDDYSNPTKIVATIYQIRTALSSNGPAKLMRDTLGPPSATLRTPDGSGYPEAAEEKPYAEMEAAWKAVQQTAPYVAAQQKLNAENRTYFALSAARDAARGADRRAQELSGEIAYSVEATDDGQAYITLLPTGAN